MKQIKVAASYWEKLSDKERRVFEELACKYEVGIQYTKRILKLAKKYFPEYTQIIPSCVLNPSFPIYLTGGVSKVFGEDGRLGSITKSAGIGVTERIKKYENDKYIEIWHN